MKKFLLSLCMLTICFSAVAQQKMSWKNHVKLADEFFEKSLYADAAAHYEAAWRQKSRKKELIHKAAECYYIIKDYKKAAAAYKNIKDERKDFPLAGLRYARSLKQDGKFDEASREFIYFLNNYEGADKPVVTEIVQNEIRGCELGIKLYAQPKNKTVTVSHIGSNINSPETEFAPIPFNDDVLYYSSTMSNKARIYFTMREKNGDWKKATLPKNFPNIPDEHFCNGTLSPDGKRFYFTICKSIEAWGGLTTKCDIHVIKKIGDTWTTPQRLRDYVNLAGSTTTHPYVVHENGKEILYFSSNREGSIGGMDLWYVERNIDSEDIDFTFPVNLGPQINTLGDDITPFYDSNEGALYFSSNGQVSLGGHDIFKTKGRLTNWSPPENIGLPYNSPADDFFFVLTPSRSGGFFASNRIFGMEKITTTHEDLFEFRFKQGADLVAGAPQGKQQPIEKEMPLNRKPLEEPAPKTPPGKETARDKPIVLQVRGGIYDKYSDEKIEAVNVALYELLKDNSKRLLSVKNFRNGNFEFALIPGKKFYIEAQKEGYRNGSIQINTLGEQTDFEEDIFIAKMGDEGAIAVVPPPATKEAPPRIMEEEPTPATKPEPATSKPQKNKTPKVNTSPRKNTPAMEQKNEVVVESTELDLDYEGSTYVSRGRTKYDNAEFSTAAPRHDGEYYKIQLIAVRDFEPRAARFEKVKNMGRITTEFLLSKKLNRVLLGDFFSLGEAKDKLHQVQASGFPRAFIVRYKDGERYGMIYR